MDKRYNYGKKYFKALVLAARQADEEEVYRICQRMPLGYCGRKQPTKPQGDLRDKAAWQGGLKTIF